MRGLTAHIWTAAYRVTRVHSDAPAGNPLVGPVAAGGVGNPLVVDVTASITIGPTVDELGA